MFAWAHGHGSKNLPYVCKDKPSPVSLAFKFNLFDKLVFCKFQEALGMDRMQFAISGGGPLSVSDAEFFIGMGIKILEGFGLTETTPVTNVNPPGKIKPGTVGPAIPETKVKIADDGELLIKGPQVMKGYYKNPKATKEVFTKDGFFRTGDIGEIDDDGYAQDHRPDQGHHRHRGRQEHLAAEHREQPEDVASSSSRWRSSATGGSTSRP